LLWQRLWKLAAETAKEKYTKSKWETTCCCSSSTVLMYICHHSTDNKLAS
jgi:hypothetical protein